VSHRATAADVMRGVGSLRTPSAAPKADTLTEQAYYRLEEMIVTLALAPGAVLSEQALSGELGIGRTPIREALQRLAREGLVLVLPRKAIIVTETDPRRQLLVLEVRRGLERLLARTGAERASAAQRARFQAIAKGMEAAARTSDDIAFMRLDRELNTLLADASHNEYAARAMRMLNGICTTSRQPTCRRWPGCMPMKRARSPRAAPNGRWSPPTS
jgi:DNA-binding GntR family transcriptional regulator